MNLDFFLVLTDNMYICWILFAVNIFYYYDFFVSLLVPGSVTFFVASN